MRVIRRRTAGFRMTPGERPATFTLSDTKRQNEIHIDLNSEAARENVRLRQQGSFATHIAISGAISEGDILLSIRPRRSQEEALRIACEVARRSIENDTMVLKI